MKKIISILCLLIANFGFSQKAIITNSEVKSVNLYRNSAELNSVAELNIPKGISEIVIKNIPENIEEKSLQISVNSDDVNILSMQSDVDYEFVNGNKEKELENKIKNIDNRIAKANIRKKANAKTIQLLDKNQNLLVGNTTSSVTQLKQLTAFYTKKRIELSEIGLKIHTEIEKLKQQKNDLLNKKIDLDDVVCLVLKVSSNSSKKVKLSINYITYKASWKPFYEIKTNAINQPLNINLKAFVNQETGVNWKNVKLNLINGNSSRNNYAPEPQTWFLNAYRPDKQKLYKSAPAPMMAEKNAVLDEVVVTGYAPPRVNELNTNYNVSIPYDITSNGEDHLISLYSQKIDADYKFFTIPKYDKSVFLVANIKDFGKYNLIRAKASIIFENMYVGETFITPHTTKKELRITLGNVPKINVKKVKIKDKSGQKFLSSKQVKTITYDLIIKNNKNKNVNIEVKDIYPISKNDAIEIELLEISGAKNNTEKGFLTWNLKLEPKEIKKIRVSYKVTYPKDFKISL